MSEQEVNLLRDRICYGLQVAEWKMLKEKALRNDTIITKTHGEVKEVSARYMYKKIYGGQKDFPSTTTK